MTVNLKRYNTAFRLNGEGRGFQIAPGVMVTIRELGMKEVPHPPHIANTKGRMMRSTAVLELEMGFLLYGPDDAPDMVDHCTCASCGAWPPDPDQDALWYMFENGAGGLIAFPKMADDRFTSGYPATGWTRIDDGRYCPTCTEKVRAAIAAVKAAAP